MCHKLPVAAYARVSSDHQTRQRTIESQLADLEARVEQDGLDWSQVSTFVDDGHSGETLERPALERLRDGIALAEIGCIYIHSPDRLARRYACQVLLLEEFRRQGVEVIFFNHRTEASPEGELLLQIHRVPHGGLATQRRVDDSSASGLQGANPIW